MNIWLVIYFALAAVAIVETALVTLQTFEHRRFSRSRIGRPKAQGPQGRVALIVPCKGVDADLCDNLRPLFNQDHPNYELTFVVESGQDPAAAMIRELMRDHPRSDARLIVAGKATDCGQKVHNLLAASADLSPEVEILAFADSDARPRAPWLRLLVQHLDDPRSAAATAYRWFIPAHATLANHLLYSLNCAVAPLIGPSRHSLVWGGSWAIRLDEFESLELHEAWKGTLSDDLVASAVLDRAHKRVEFEPACMVASPLSVDTRAMLEFVRRQYTIGRVYSPRWWALGLLMALIVQGVFWGSLLAALACDALLGAPTGWIPASIAAMLYFLFVIKAWLRQDASRHYLPEWQGKLGSARRFDVWLNPLAGLVHLWAMVTSAFTRRIVWRGIGYRMFRGGKVAVFRDDVPVLRTDNQPRINELRKAG